MVSLCIFLCLSINAGFLFIFTYFMKSQLFETCVNVGLEIFSLRWKEISAADIFFKVARLISLWYLWDTFDFAPNLFAPNHPHLIFYCSFKYLNFFSNTSNWCSCSASKQYSLHFNLYKFFSSSHFVRCLFEIVTDFYDSSWSWS